jgi:uncharacterized membrane protein YgcG
VTSIHLPLPAASLAGVALLLGACGGGEDDQGPTSSTTISDPTLATVLAEGADRLADHLAAGDHCEALEEAELLYARSREGADVGAVHPAVAREVEDVAASLTRDLTCEPGEDEPDPEAEPDREAEPEPAEGTSSSGSSSAGGNDGGSSSAGGNDGGNNGGGDDGASNSGKGNAKGKGKGK